MEISFTRKAFKKHIISCKRTDGSVTWMQCDDFFVHHDLMHYAVETIMHYRNAFYGMLESGIDISDFELPKEKRTFNYSSEALHSETLVGLINTELSQGNFEDMQQVTREMYELNYPSVTAPELSPELVTRIKEKYQELVLYWMKLVPNEKLTLQF